MKASDWRTFELEEIRLVERWGEGLNTRLADSAGRMNLIIHMEKYFPKFCFFDL